MGDIPGGFPQEWTQTYDYKVPSQEQFTFQSQTAQSLRHPLYPDLDQLMPQVSSSLQEQCSQLGYSKKLSNNVLQELDQRAATMHPRRSHIGKGNGGSTLSPRNSRFTSLHRQKFNKLESISSHYSTMRTREEIELEKENVPSYDPFSKRTGSSTLESVSKRRRLDVGRQDVVPQLSSSKRMMDFQQVLDRPAQNHELVERVTTTRIPLKAPTQSTLRQSTSSMNLKKQHSTSLQQSRSISKGLSKVPSPRISKSTTMYNLNRPTASSLQKSTSTRDVARSLRSTPSMNNLSSMTRTTSTMNTKQHQKPAWR